MAGSDGETAGLVSKDLAGNWFGLDGCVAVVSAMVGRFRSWESKFIVVVVDWHGWTCFGISGRTLVFPGLVEVAFEHGLGGWWILLECCGGEAGKVVDALSV